VKFLAYVIASLLISGVCQCHANQYWKVAGSTTQVYSLDDNAFVAVSDSGYTTWLGTGQIATRIASSAELYDVISVSFPQHRAAAVAPLEATGGLTPAQSLTARRYAGIQITYTGHSDLNGTYAIDDQWLSGLMAGSLIRCDTTSLSSCTNPFPEGGATYGLTDFNGVPHTMTSPQMKIISLAIQDYWANCIAQALIAGGGGTPTWPSNSVTVP
jgi:hypothetical protein